MTGRSSACRGSGTNARCHSGARRRREPGIQGQSSSCGVALDSGPGASRASRNDEVGKRMITRREILQVGAATAALAAGGGFTRAMAQQRLTRSRTAEVRRARQRHAAACRRHPRPTDAGLFPRAVDQSRRRRGEGAAAASDGQGFSQALRYRGEIRRGLCADRRRISPRWRKPMAASAGSIAWRPWSSACAPNAATRCCSSTAAIPGRARSAPTRATARTWSTAWPCSSRTP